MSIARFTFTDRVRPVVELGIGDSRTMVGAVWDDGRWDTAAYWSGLEPEWLDVTCHVYTAGCTYGRQATTDRFVPGVASIVVDNTTGWADPNAADEPGVLTLRPGRPVRISVIHQVYGRRVLFRGFVDTMTPTYDPDDRDVVALDCIDALGEVNRTKLRPVDPPVGANEAASTRINRILTAANWLPRDVAPSSETLIGTDLGGQVADLLGRTADSAGGVVFGDLEGRVAFRPRDWQTYAPGTPIDGTIGNVKMGSPGIPPTLLEHGYLTPTIGTVTTPDPGPLPNECTFVFKVRGPTTTTGGAREIVSQYESAPYSYRLRRQPSANPATRGLVLTTSTTGAVASTTGTTTVASTNLAVETLALAVQFDDAGQQRLRSWVNTGGVWTAAAAASSRATVPVIDASSVMRIGASTVDTSVRWDDRIYSVELRTGLDPAAGTVVWRFDADDYPGTGTTYDDPRGRTWTLTAAGAITPKVVDPGAPAVPADVCPTRWERPFARADITTRAIIGRDRETAVVVDDWTGINKYGIEPFERTDLLTLRDTSLTMLANRVLRTHGEATAPRVRSVTLDARTSTEALDLMSTVDVYRPSRYRCRLQYPPPRGLVFDDDYFATGVAHELTPDGWTLDLNLDVAAPFEAAGGRWDSAYWDLATWTDAVAVLADLRRQLAALEVAS